jgi:methylated-DNA-[protein]-cysteine S-methyltransferase
MRHNRTNTAAGYCISLYETKLGFGAVVASEAGLVEVVLPFAGTGAAEMVTEMAGFYPAAQTANALTEETALLLQRYFSGQPVSFRLQIDTRGFTPFQVLVYEKVAAIPYGQVKTYAQVAAEIGCKGAARGIGTAMARNPVPIIIPCHRVVGAAGTMTGYSAAGGVASKRFLLSMEGVTLDGRGRVPRLN